MKKLETFVAWGLLIAGLSLPQAAFAISGCSTASLKGNFDAQTTNLGLQNFVQGLNQSTAKPTAGLTDNSNSMIGSQSGIGRFYFDGAGNIVGLATVAKGANSFNSVVGSYKVNDDCSGSVTIGSAAYDIIITQPGKTALYLETDKGGAGNLGTLARSGACNNVVPGSSYAASFSSADGSGTTYAPFSTMGTVTLLANGVATLSYSTVQDGAVTRGTDTPTYTINSDCTLSIKLSDGSALSGVITNGGLGSLTLTPKGASTPMASGSLVAQ